MCTQPAGAKEDESEEEEGPREAAPSQPQSRKSKKKKKKVKKDAEEDAPASKQAQQEEDLDKVLAELNIVQQQVGHTPTRCMQCRPWPHFTMLLIFGSVLPELGHNLPPRCLKNMCVSKISRHVVHDGTCGRATACEL